MQHLQYDHEKATIGKLLGIAADQFCDHQFLNYHKSGLSKSYRDTEKICNAAAKGFMALGVAKGDHVALWANNIPEWVYCKFAIAKAGGVIVTVNTNLRCFELEYLMQHSDTTTLVMVGGVREGDEYLKIIENLCPDLALAQPGQINCNRFPKLKSIIFLGDEHHCGMLTWRELLKAGESVTDRQLREREDSIQHEDTVNMLYTSGTTGFPKGVMLSHKNVIGNAEALGRIMNLSPEDSVCVPVPFFHCFGCVAGILTSLVSGATLCPVPSFNSQEVLETVEGLKCTALHGVPTMFISELEEMEKREYDTSSLRTGIIAGSMITRTTMQKIMAKMGIPEINIAYGQTESSPAITATTPSDPLEDRLETVGRPLPCLEVKIVNPYTGEELEHGVQGEVCVRGYNVMQGYYKNYEATQNTIDSYGWLHTGDLGTMNRRGYCMITGRIKDVIIRGGENIYPIEIETFLLSHPDIMEAQVVGIPNDRYGEEVHAFVKLAPRKSLTEKELKDFCKNKIAFHKIPSYFIFNSEYPTTASGKVQKFKLVEQVLENIKQDHA